MNIGREYSNKWHDLLVKVAGPIVGRLHKDFNKRWAHTGIAGALAFAIASMGRESHAGNAGLPDYIEIRPLYTRSGDSQILHAQLAAIRQAKSRIWIEQPYVSEDMVISELIRTRRRGVDVRIIMPARGNSGLMNSANLVAARAFLNNGIRVCAYPGMRQVKAALYDIRRPGYRRLGQFRQAQPAYQPEAQSRRLGSRLRSPDRAGAVRNQLPPLPGNGPRKSRPGGANTWLNSSPINSSPADDNGLHCGHCTKKFDKQ